MGPLNIKVTEISLQDNTLESPLSPLHALKELLHNTWWRHTSIYERPILQTSNKPQQQHGLTVLSLMESLKLGATALWAGNMKERTCSFFRLKHWDNGVCVRCIYNRSHWIQHNTAVLPNTQAKAKQTRTIGFIAHSLLWPVSPCPLVGRCYSWETHIHTVQLCVMEGQ